MTTILSAFRSAAAAKPTDPLLVYFDGVLSYGEVDRISDAFGVALADSGFRRGDRIALYLQNLPQYVLALISAWKLGGVVVAVNPMLTPREVSKLLTDSTPTVLVTLDELHSAELAEVVDRSSVSSVITSSALDFQAAGDDRILPAVRAAIPKGAHDFAELVRQYDDRVPAETTVEADDVAVITYTSGTTGAPKGAMNTHRNVATGGYAYRDWFALSDRDVVLGIAPLFHVTGLTGHIACTIAAGASLVLSYRFNVDVVLDMIRRHRPTFTVGAITVFIALGEAPGVDSVDLS